MTGWSHADKEGKEGGCETESPDSYMIAIGILETIRVMQQAGSRPGIPEDWAGVRNTLTAAGKGQDAHRSHFLRFLRHFSPDRRCRSNPNHHEVSFTGLHRQPSLSSLQHFESFLP